MQVTWWSETPAFDRECVQFAIDVVLEIAQANNMIYKVSTDPSASYSVNEMLLKARLKMKMCVSSERGLNNVEPARKSIV